jgi:hypothetical protein
MEPAVSAQRIDALFNRRCSRWGYRDSCTDRQATYRAFLAGRFRMTLRRVPAEWCRLALNAEVRCEGGEGEDHARLKLAALLWMRNDGADDATREARGIVGIADVYSKNANWIVECGNTRFGKLADAALWEDAPRFTLIPFQSLRRSDLSPRRFIAIDFAWTKELTADLEDARMYGLQIAADALELDDLSPLPTMEAAR